MGADVTGSTMTTRRITCRTITCRAGLPAPPLFEVAAFAEGLGVDPKIPKPAANVRPPVTHARVRTRRLLQRSFRRGERSTLVGRSSVVIAVILVFDLDLVALVLAVVLAVIVLVGPAGGTHRRAR